MRVLFSIAWSKTFTPPTGAFGNDQIDVRVQRSDWNLRGFRKLWYHILETLRILRAARGCDTLVLCTVSVEAILAGALKPLICPGTRIVCFDLLMPRRNWPARWFLPRLDAFACIRSGDIETLVHRLGVSRERCSFVPFPCPELDSETDHQEGGYVYAAGSSYRDWPTLIDAVAQTKCPAIFSTSDILVIPDSAKDRITIVPQQSPRNGRELMAHASVVAVSLKDTHLSNGPLVLLDAMAMGKAVVVTLVNGTRDYVTPDTAIGVSPADVHAMATAIGQLMENPAIRHRLGAAAQAHVRRHFTFARTMEGIMALCKIESA